MTNLPANPGTHSCHSHLSLSRKQRPTPAAILEMGPVAATSIKADPIMPTQAGQSVPQLTPLLDDTTEKLCTYFTLLRGR